MDVKYIQRAAALAASILVVASSADAQQPTPTTTTSTSTSTPTSTSTSTPTSTSTSTPTSTSPSPAASTSPAESAVDPIAAEKPLSITERRHTMAVLEGGIIALPNAPISNSQRGGSVPFTTVGHGDATLQTGVRLLYRGGRDWTVGFGALFGPSPTSDSEYGGLKSLPRTHSRNYMVFTTEGRYVPLRTARFEGWLGLVGGGVVIADRFSTDAGDLVPSVLGKKIVTIRTEGFVLGLQAGLTWNFAERWGAGVVVRGSQWFLPTTPSCSPIGDCATLEGSVQSFEAGLSIGYRIPL